MNEPIQIELNIRIPELGFLFRGINAKLDALLRKESEVMSTLKDTQSAVADEKTVADGLVTLTDNIKTQLDGFLAGKLNAEQQAQVDDIFASVSAERQAMADAL